MSKTAHPRRGRRSRSCEWCGARRGAIPVHVKHFIVQLCKPCRSVPPSRCVVCQAGGEAAQGGWEHLHRTKKQAAMIARKMNQATLNENESLNIHALGTVDAFEQKYETGCPCGETVRVGHVRGSICVSHMEPRCTKFEELSPVDFLRWVNFQRAKAEERISDGMTVMMGGGANGREVYLSCFGGMHDFCEMEMRMLRRKFGKRAVDCGCLCHAIAVAEAVPEGKRAEA